MRITQGWWMVADDVDSADLGSYSNPVFFLIKKNVGASSGKTKIREKQSMPKMGIMCKVGKYQGNCTGTVHFSKCDI
jgi:hypothetical protein